MRIIHGIQNDPAIYIKVAIILTIWETIYMWSLKGIVDIIHTHTDEISIHNKLYIYTRNLRD